MKKKDVKKQYPSIRKHSTFKSLWVYYRKVQKDYVKALKRHQETKAAYAELKSKKADKALLKAWKGELKNSKKSKQFLDAIVKDARRHIKRWLKAYYAMNDLADGRSKLKTEKEKKKKAAPKKASKAPKKAAKKPTVSKSKPAAKPETTPAKPKATPAKTKMAIAQKVTVAKTVVAKTTPPKPAASKRKAAPNPAHVAAPPPSKTTTKKATSTRRRTTTARPDNLKRVEGIGVKIEQLLRNAGIDSFEKLSNSTQATLRKLLDEAGPHYRISDPTTWPKQAGLAAQGKWDELKTWQDELKGGRIVK